MNEEEQKILGTEETESNPFSPRLSAPVGGLMGGLIIFEVKSLLAIILTPAHQPFCEPV